MDPKYRDKSRYRRVQWRITNSTTWPDQSSSLEWLVSDTEKNNLYDGGRAHALLLVESCGSIREEKLSGLSNVRDFAAEGNKSWIV